MNCPVTSKSCSENECLAYCSLLRTKLYKVIPPLKMCPGCHQYLIPFGDIWLHSPESKCKYALMIGVTLEVTRDDYEKDLGKPKGSFNDLVVHLTTEPKSWLRRAYISLKQRLNSLKQRKQSKTPTDKP